MRWEKKRVLEGCLYSLFQVIVKRVGEWSNKVTCDRGMVDISLSSRKEKMECANIIAQSSLVKTLSKLTLNLDKKCQFPLEWRWWDFGSKGPNLLCM